MTPIREHFAPARSALTYTPRKWRWIAVRLLRLPIDRIEVAYLFGVHPATLKLWEEKERAGLL